MAESPWVVDTAALGAAAALGGADFLRLGQGGVSKKLTITALLAGLAISTLAAGTLTTSQPMTLTQTWNASGVTFIGYSIDVTSTDSHALSQPFRVRVGGITVFSVQKDGTITIPTGTNNNANAALRDGRFVVGSASYFAWTNAVNAFTTEDLFLYRDAANTLAQRNGAAAQTLRLYATFIDASNYTRMDILAGRLTLTNAGSGAVDDFFIDNNIIDRSIFFRVAPGGSLAVKWTIQGTTGHFLTGIDNSYDIGASGATRPRNLYVAGFGNFAGALTTAGNINLGIATNVVFGLHSVISSLADGTIRLSNQNIDGFGSLLLGPSGTTYNRIKHGGAGILDFRLADDSNYCFVRGKHRTEANAVSEAITPTHSLTMWDAAGTAYKVAVQAA